VKNGEVGSPMLDYRAAYDVQRVGKESQGEEPRM
jgi:hypothetical protein